MGIISNLHDNIKARIEEKTSKIKEKREEAAKKRLAAKLKYMNDDELEEYIMLQIKKLQKGNKDTKKEAKTAVHIGIATSMLFIVLSQPFNLWMSQKNN